MLTSSEQLRSNYDTVVLAVAHNEFKDLDIEGLKSEIGVIFDVKSLLPKEIVDARL